MKILLSIIALGLLAQSTHAFTLEDLSGTWVGTRISKENGKTQSQPATFKFTKSRGGLVEHLTTKLASGTLKSTGKYFPYVYYDGSIDKNYGAADFLSTKNGKVLTVASGDWSFDGGDTLTIYLSSNSDDRSSTTTIRLTNRKTFVLAIRTSTGSITGRFFRK